MSPTTPSWKLWTCRYEDGALWSYGDGTLGHVGEQSRVKDWLMPHQLSQPIVPVLVKEVPGNLYAPEVTHYGWRCAEGSLTINSATSP